LATANEKMPAWPVVWLADRCPPRAAARALRESRRGRKQRREAVDSAAATLLLRSYLERARNTALDEPA
jgi:RNase H-fold protein (predicted Holliday junction resolvase)